MLESISNDSTSKRKSCAEPRYFIAASSEQNLILYTLPKEPVPINILAFGTSLSFKKKKTSMQVHI